jgi:hypothetical protein
MVACPFVVAFAPAVGPFPSEKFHYIIAYSIGHLQGHCVLSSVQGNTGLSTVYPGLFRPLPVSDRGNTSEILVAD